MIDKGDGLYTIESAEELQELCRMARETKSDFDKQVAFMTKEQALEIKRLRCVEAYSWRALAYEIHERGWFGKFSPKSNQLAGVALHEKAKEVLNEDFDYTEETK